MRRMLTGSRIANSFAASTSINVDNDASSDVDTEEMAEAEEEKEDMAEGGGTENDDACA